MPPLPPIATGRPDAAARADAPGEAAPAAGRIAAPRGIARAARAGRADGWGALALLAPHLALGGWLLAVPDHVAFTASQVVTLAHVGLALVALPVTIVLALRHVRGSWPRTRRAPSARVARWALTVAAAGAFGTGVAALWSGEGMPVARAHAIVGAAVAAPLALHLWLERRRAASLIVAAAMALALVGIAVARRAIPPDSPAPREPAFAYRLRPVSLYDEAAWCGSCHPRNFDEWSRSTHGRTMRIPHFRDDFGRRPDSLAVDLASVGRAVRDPSGPAAEHVAAPPDQCPLCHAPTSYFGDDPVSPLAAAPPSSDGVTCSFCHTLRGVRYDPAANGRVRAAIALARAHGGQGVPNPLKIFDDVPMYVSAPETVRRYLGQAAPGRLARLVGDLLIRWRPEMHRRDYHSPILDGSRACQVCHGIALDAPETPHKTYPDWESSPYNAAKSTKRVECQDCHMSGTLTGRPTREPDRIVPWGPVRPQRRSHLFLGGNAAADLLFHDGDGAARQHALVAASVRLEVASARLDGAAIDVRLVVHNDLVGHGFPGMETVQRAAWITLAAYDAAGRAIARSGPPDLDHPERSTSPILFRYVDPKTVAITSDTTVPARGSRTLEARLPLPAGAAPPARIEASLFHSFDPQPIHTATSSVAAGPP